VYRPRIVLPLADALAQSGHRAGELRRAARLDAVRQAARQDKKVRFTGESEVLPDLLELLAFHFQLQTWRTTMTGRVRRPSFTDFRVKLGICKCGRSAPRSGLIGHDAMVREPASRKNAVPLSTELHRCGRMGGSCEALQMN
jgi:hypothetical protein